MAIRKISENAMKAEISFARRAITKAHKNGVSTDTLAKLPRISKKSPLEVVYKQAKESLKQINRMDRESAKPFVDEIRKMRRKAIEAGYKPINEIAKFTTATTGTDALRSASRLFKELKKITRKDARFKKQQARAELKKKLTNTKYREKYKRVTEKRKKSHYVSDLIFKIESEYNPIQRTRNGKYINLSRYTLNTYSMDTLKEIDASMEAIMERASQNRERDKVLEDMYANLSALMFKASPDHVKKQVDMDVLATSLNKPSFVSLEIENINRKEKGAPSREHMNYYNNLLRAAVNYGLKSLYEDLMKYGVDYAIYLANEGWDIKYIYDKGEEMPEEYVDKNREFIPNWKAQKEMEAQGITRNADLVKFRWNKNMKTSGHDSYIQDDHEYSNHKRHFKKLKGIKK